VHRSANDECDLRALGTRVDLVARYVAAASRLCYADVRDQQASPWASAAFGAPGVAYALWRAAEQRRGAWLDAANRILTTASDAALEDYWSKDFGAPSDCRFAMAYGVAGVSLVHALVARSRDDEPTYVRSLGRFVEACSLPHGRDEELLMGTSGLLNGARILHAATGEEGLRRCGESLATSLAARMTLGPGVWLAAKPYGFAHGSAGILHALLAWYHHAGERIPAEVSATLERFAVDVRMSGALPLPGASPSLSLSFCNGSAGLAILWVKAYEHTRDYSYRELALAAAREVSARAGTPNGDLCCGLAGRAQALLAVDRIAPKQGWGERASELADCAALIMSRLPCRWQHGLYKGWPGLVCLHLDSLSAPDARVGFPLVEG
jgi:lantibiotic modifying enzyme